MNTSMVTFVVVLLLAAVLEASGKPGTGNVTLGRWRHKRDVPCIPQNSTTDVISCEPTDGDHPEPAATTYLPPGIICAVVVAGLILIAGICWAMPQPRRCIRRHWYARLEAARNYQEIEIREHAPAAFGNQEGIPESPPTPPNSP
eukprot:scpid107678/ scgid30312/ 